MKAIVVNGEFPGIPSDRKLSDSAAYAVGFIERTPVEKLYTFAVSDSVLDELRDLADYYRSKIVDKRLKSLQLIQDMGL